jgi:hypothetical protein
MYYLVPLQMVSVELIAIIITGVMSGLDLVINGFALCMSGKCEVTCCGNTMRHVDTEGDLVDLARRMSNPQTKNDDEDKNGCSDV